VISCLEASMSAEQFFQRNGIMAVDPCSCVGGRVLTSRAQLHAIPLACTGLIHSKGTGRTKRACNQAPRSDSIRLRPPVETAAQAPQRHLLKFSDQDEALIIQAVHRRPEHPRDGAVPMAG
jgi:hypothetical protein